MKGYDSAFLDGFSIPLPTYSAELEGSLLTSVNLDGGVIAHYPTYSIVTNREMRTPVFAALNIDQRGVEQGRTTRSDRWRVDTRIGAEYQLSNDYYYRNRWDRGHLARRESAGWGLSQREAQFASDETFYFSNCTLQHENFNQDEWLALEDWVLQNPDTKGGRITSFSIPYFGGDIRAVKPVGREPAYVPAAFFKVVVYVDKSSGNLETRAFVMYQDTDALIDKKGRTVFNYQRYQITTTEVEEKTGLRFDDALYHTNPLYYFDREATREEREDRGVNHLPERIEVDSEAEVVDSNDEREYIADDEVEVYISSAMVDAVGNERVGEWISVLNMSADTVDLSGWELSDERRARLRIGSVCGDCVMRPGVGINVSPILPLQLLNHGGVISLYDDRGRRIDRLKYSRQDVVEGMPVNFFYQPSMRT